MALQFIVYHCLIQEESHIFKYLQSQKVITTLKLFVIFILVLLLLFVIFTKHCGTVASKIWHLRVFPWSDFLSIVKGNAVVFLGQICYAWQFLL